MEANLALKTLEMKDKPHDVEHKPVVPAIQNQTADNS